jgi:hypothetical protein
MSISGTSTSLEQAHALGNQRLEVPSDKKHSSERLAFHIIGIVALPPIAAIASVFFLAKTVYSLGVMIKHRITKAPDCPSILDAVKKNLCQSVRMLASIIPGASLYWMFQGGKNLGQIVFNPQR